MRLEGTRLTHRAREQLPQAETDRKRSYTFALAGGHVLGYAVYGAQAGETVIHLHGWPASRLEAAVIADLPCRVIAIDRPGYGLSSPQPGRRLLDLPRDVGALAEHLGVGSYRVVGVSGGAPYALACAYALPAVRGVALVSPLPPLADAAFACNGGLRRLRWLGRHPICGGLVLGAIRAAVASGLADPNRVLDGGSAPADLACLTDAARALILDCWREGLRPGVGGAVSDACVHAHDWGFDPACIDKPVAIWHGTADRVVPIECLRAYGAVRATRHILDGEGHYSLALTYASRILAALLDEPAGE